MTQLIDPGPLSATLYGEVALLEGDRSEIGSGAYGKVCMAVCNEMPVAAKLIHTDLFRYNIPSNQDKIEKFQKECDLMARIRHPCIVQFLTRLVHPETGQAVLVMELMDHSLTTYLEKATNVLPCYNQVNICHDVSHALSFLHLNGLIHRNLTGMNVLVIADGSRAKIADFRIVEMMENINPQLKHHTTQCCTYMPPEVFKSPEAYNEKLDVFSFGVVALQTITRQYPNGENRDSDIKSVKKDNPLLPIALSCLKDRDFQRPTTQQVCQSIAKIKDQPRYKMSRQKVIGRADEIERLKQKLEDVWKDKVKIQNDQICSSCQSKANRSPVTPVSNGHNGHNGHITPDFESSSSTNGSIARSDYLDFEVRNDDEAAISKMNLTAAPPTSWYHGKISRQTASVRLEAHKQPGAFLVRESGSEPGNLVLSFLDREERVFHYMINYKDGQYNTAGQTSNWFSTLEELIGYYTKYSTVKKNQHLDKPVPPPEAVPLPRSSSN